MPGRASKVGASRNEGAGRQAPSASGRGATTLELILQASTELFAERGFYGTSMRQLAESCDVALSHFYYYYRSKYDVLLAIIEEAIASIEGAADAVPEELDPDQRLTALLAGHVRVHLRAPALARVSDREIGVLKPEDLKRMRGRLDRYEDLFRAAIADGVRGGQFAAGVDVPVAAKSMLLMATGVIEWWRPGGRLSVEETSELIARYGTRVASVGSER